MSDAGANVSIELTELERIVKGAEPLAWLVPPRILRRVIKNELGITRLGVYVPHRWVYVTTGKSLREVVAEDELGLEPGAGWPALAILLERPSAEDLAASSRSVILRHYWRMLFHAQVHLAMERSVAFQGVFDGAIDAIIARLGSTVYEEIRSVLRQEGLILATADDRTVFIEFAAYYLELRRFAPALLPHTFPNIENPAPVEFLLSEFVDDELIFGATRLPGADEPSEDVIPGAGDDEDEEEEDKVEVEPASQDDGAVDNATGAIRRLIDRADLIGSRGNLVRAAILRTEAARRSTTGAAESLRAGARSDLDHLVVRLQRALGFDAGEAERWRRTLPTLLDRSARGFWTPEARLLYDIQKVCVDHEREFFTVDLVGWIASWGRLPIRRAQPYLREVMTANHLRSASKRLTSTHLRGEDRTRLAALLQAAVKHAESVLRVRLRGPIDATLTTTGFKPRNLPERVAYRKLIEELLDRIATRGFLSIGDLRDACSRSNLKLPDLSGPREFFHGDLLLQADRALTISLDGVYRRGEFYLRWLQRFSSLAFATTIGRFITTYLVLPYGGTYLLLEGLQHILDAVLHQWGGSHVHMTNKITVLTLGTVALGVLDFPKFRQGFLLAIRMLGRGLRILLIDSLAWILRHPILQLILVGRFATLLWRFLLKPGAIAGLAWGLTLLLGLGATARNAIAAVVFIEAVFVMNSRLGRNFEEIVADELVRTWKLLYRDIVPGLYRIIVNTFDKVLETVDRLLYSVDEWLRFRTGQGRLMLISKAVLGTGWFMIAYLVRFYVNLLIEPQVNPIKHFPVVTVSHKIILPMSRTLTHLLAAPLMPLGKVVANLIALSTVFLLPGVFGFLVWEFKENYRLYRANRRESLGPVAVGSHGETISRLLRPGFHSGTLPKLFARLRKGERRWIREGRVKGVLKQSEALHHVEEAIHRFIEREFLALLHESRTIGPMEIQIAGLAVSTNRISIELSTRRENSEVIRIEFVEQSGRLIAEVTDPGWLSELSEMRRQTLATAIIGLYKLSGIDQIRSRTSNDLTGDLARADRDRTDSGARSFQRVTITWRNWVEAWEKKLSATALDPNFTEGLGILPPHSSHAKRGSESPTARHQTGHDRH